jgi:two-component sensor histidine kinase
MEEFQRNTRILYVDDEQALLTVVALLLRREDVEAYTLQDPTQIEKMLDDHGPFAIVLSDQRMPGMDGVKVLEAVARRHPSTVRVMVTGYVDHNDIVRAINGAGITSYISKPWNDVKLRQYIRDSIDRYNLLEEKASVTRQLQSAHASLTSLLEQATNGDVSGRRNAAEMVKSLMREKELMLKEIHHRVKNNLQVISSILTMQASNISSAASRSLFACATGRIRAMAQVHEAMYRSDDLGSIDFFSYLEIQLLEIAAQHPVEAVTSTVEGDRITLGVDVAVPLGLIAHELLTNAYMHAFAGRHQGRLQILLRSGEDGALELNVSDDGAGFGRGPGKPSSAGLGMLLVSALIEELSATMTRSEENGTQYRIRVPLTHAE